MSLETISAVVVKFGWTSILPYLLWLHKKDKNKLDDTYTKKETDERIDFKITPVKSECSNNTEILNNKFDLLLSLMKENNTKSDNNIKENTLVLSQISTDVAVVKNEVKHLKDQMTKG